VWARRRNGCAEPVRLSENRPAEPTITYQSCADASVVEPIGGVYPGPRADNNAVTTPAWGSQFETPGARASNHRSVSATSLRYDRRRYLGAPAEKGVNGINTLGRDL